MKIIFSQLALLSAGITLAASENNKDPSSLRRLRSGETATVPSENKMGQVARALTGEHKEVTLDVTKALSPETEKTLKTVKSSTPNAEERDIWICYDCCYDASNGYYYDCCYDDYWNYWFAC